LLDLTQQKLDEKIGTINTSVKIIDSDITTIKSDILSLNSKLEKLELARTKLNDQLLYLSGINHDDFNLKCNQFDPISGIL
jgi:peptidoglycan hydrolase CwlO-like protein